jgi:hypothetical protein
MESILPVLTVFRAIVVGACNFRSLCSLDTDEALIFPDVEQLIIVRISNGDPLGGLATGSIDLC